MNIFKSRKDVQVVRLSCWLDWACRNGAGPFIALPMIQRGSVWRPHQVIELWDSLLQGMPIGSMMVSELKEGTFVRQLGKNYSEMTQTEGGLALVDGQQRTLAMLIAWSRTVEMDRRIWVDFADVPAPGQLLRLRLTTTNQPFGFKINEPSRKLSLDDRRKARSTFQLMNDKQAIITIDTAWPFSQKPVLPVDLRRMIDLWNEKCDNNAWTAGVTAILRQVFVPRPIDHDGTTWTKDLVWDMLDEAEQGKAIQRVEELAIALSRLSELEVPLIRVHERFFETRHGDDSDPPLATLFNRIGTGGTPLSDADYVYSVIKHLRPESYDLVESLQGQNKTVASLLTATDLVMSTVRLAIVDWYPVDGRPVADLESPSKRDFHRLLRRGDFIDERFLPLIRSPEQKSRMSRYFDEVQSMLIFKEGDDIGLPKQMFPLLKRPLVQILLLLAHVGYLNSATRNREDVLRLVLYWLVSVTDPPKASRLAYEVISASSGRCGDIGKTIHDRLISESVSVLLPNPEEITADSGPAFSLRETGKMRGESRFDPTKYAESNYSGLLQFYRNHWWRPWTHEHPILLWLQRDMVAAKFDTEADPLAGRDEDTPYDYDHILMIIGEGGPAQNGARRCSTSPMAKFT